MYYRRLSKTGQISIPKIIQQQLDLQEGHFLYIYHYQGSIMIVNHHSNQTLNQCIFRNGKISIPVELRRLVGVSVETPLEMTFAHKQIIIKVA